MEFDNHFTVNAPLPQVWDFLLNVQEVAPCMPGAQLTEVVSDTEYRGIVKVKLGAVQMSYKGTATMREIDPETHTVVLVASGRETRGTGNASSTTTSHLEADGPDRTLVTLHSQVDVSGRVAQFGRSIMQDVASRLIGEFARNLEAKLAAEGDTQPAAATAPADTAVAAEPAAGGEAAPAATTVQADEAPAPAPSPAPRPPVYVTPSTSIAGPEPQPIRMLPLMTDVARSQFARGLRKLASIVEPKG